MGLKNKVIAGTAWNLLERFSGQVVSFVVAAILARLLTPTDYGVVALLIIFTTIAGVFVDGGFGTALVQKKNVTELDYNSVFYFSIAMSVILYLVLYCLAPCIAEFYAIPVLSPILRVTAITLIFNAIVSIQNAELRRGMLFRLSFFASLIATFIGGVVGITFAYNGYGPWALAYSTVAAGISGMVARSLFIAWRPRLMFSWSSLQKMFRYGWKLLLSELLSVGFNNLHGLVIGRMYSGSDLAFVQKGSHVPSLLMNNINGTIGTVMFPALSQMQDNLVSMRDSMRRVMRLSFFLVFPLMVGLALCAKPLILVVFGDQWTQSVPYMQIACATFALYPLHTVNLQGLQAMGRSDVYLKLEIVKKALAFVVLIIFLPRSIMQYLLATGFVLGPISVLLNAYPNDRLLNYGIRMQISDILPTLALTMVMSLPVILVGRLMTESSFAMCVAVLVAQGVVGALMYMLLAVIFRPAPACELANIIVMYMDGRFPRSGGALKRLFRCA